MEIQELHKHLEIGKLPVLIYCEEKYNGIWCMLQLTKNNKIFLDFTDNINSDSEGDFRATFVYDSFEELLKEYKSEHLENVIYSSATVLYCSNAFSQVFDDISIPKPAPIQITEKVGRNEPCPCGSGKKFKNCCGKA